jgi:hypothetical protein
VSGKGRGEENWMADKKRRGDHKVQIIEQIYSQINFYTTQTDRKIDTLFRET